MILEFPVFHLGRQHILLPTPVGMNLKCDVLTVISVEQCFGTQCEYLKYVEQNYQTSRRGQ